MILKCENCGTEKVVPAGKKKRCSKCGGYLNPASARPATPPAVVDEPKPEVVEEQVQAVEAVEQQPETEPKVQQAAEPETDQAEAKGKKGKKK